MAPPPTTIMTGSSGADTSGAFSQADREDLSAEHPIDDPPLGKGSSAGRANGDKHLLVAAGYKVLQGRKPCCPRFGRNAHNREDRAYERDRKRGQAACSALDGKRFDHAADRELGYLPVEATVLAVKSSSTACEKLDWQHCSSRGEPSREKIRGSPSRPMEQQNFENSGPATQIRLTAVG